MPTRPERKAGRDTILDFERATIIDLSAIDAKKGEGNQDFTFIKKQDFHEAKGELRYKVKNGDALLEGDTNGDGKADFAVVVAGVTETHRQRLRAVTTMPRARRGES